jgi:hypothetical protein
MEIFAAQVPNKFRLIMAAEADYFIITRKHFCARSSTSKSEIKIKHHKVCVHYDSLKNRECLNLEFHVNIRALFNY